MTGPRVSSSWLADLRAAEEAATPRPWTVDGPYWHRGGDVDPDAAECITGEDRKLVAIMPERNDRRGRVTYEDARLIAAARNALPRLLAAAEAIERVRALHPRDQTANSEHYYCDRDDCDRAGEGELIPWCWTCGEDWPCNTIRALEGATDAD